MYDQPRVLAEEAISKTARVLEEADISEEKRDVIHREIGKFRESMKVSLSPPRPAPTPPHLAPPAASPPAPAPHSSGADHVDVVTCLTNGFTQRFHEAPLYYTIHTKLDVLLLNCDTV